MDSAEERARQLGQIAQQMDAIEVKCSGEGGMAIEGTEVAVRCLTSTTKGSWQASRNRNPSH